MTDHITWLTQDAYDRLKAELDDRATVQRPEIAKRIELARQEGDLSENAGYHAAREAQGMNEARIRHLTHFLEHARIGAPEVEDGVAAEQLGGWKTRHQVQSQGQTGGPKETLIQRRGG